MKKYYEVLEKFWIHHGDAVWEYPDHSFLYLTEAERDALENYIGRKGYLNEVSIGAVPMGYVPPTAPMWCNGGGGTGASGVGEFFSWSTSVNLVLTVGAEAWDYSPGAGVLTEMDGFHLDPGDSTKIICDIPGKYSIFPGGNQSTNHATNRNYAINYARVSGVTLVSGTGTMAPLGGTALSFQAASDLVSGDVIEVISNDLPLGAPAGTHSSVYFGRSLLITRIQ